MTNSTMTVSEMAPSVYRPLPEDHVGSDQLRDREGLPLIDQLVNPTWAEVEVALDRYNRDAERLRRWQWWFVGMFTFYTTLVGILVLRLAVGQ
jgi:hypothetical protein